jgi:hypothetical protein
MRVSRKMGLSLLILTCLCSLLRLGDGLCSAFRVSSDFRSNTQRNTPAGNSDKVDSVISHAIKNEQSTLRSESFNSLGNRLELALDRLSLLNQHFTAKNPVVYSNTTLDSSKSSGHAVESPQQNYALRNTNSSGEQHPENLKLTAEETNIKETNIKETGKETGKETDEVNSNNFNDNINKDAMTDSSSTSDNTNTNSNAENCRNALNKLPAELRKAVERMMELKKEQKTIEQRRRAENRENQRLLRLLFELNKEIHRRILI